LRSLKTSAQPVEGGYLLNGEKAWITKGAVCDKVMVLARLPEESADGDGLIGLLVDASSKGFQRGKPEDLMGMRGLAVSSLAFSDLFVPEDQVVGKPGKGFAQTVTALSFGRILVASLAAGIARGALKRAAEYSIERKQFGKRLWDFQNTKFRIGEFSARALAAESLIARACAIYDDGVDPVAEASAAKLLASDLAMEASTFAVQIHGAIGYSRHVDVERFMRDAKITQIYEGANEIQRHLLAKNLVTA
jgi:alkylation response protein AidB-like acyl-CoA dehydrogenase